MADLNQIELPNGSTYSFKDDSAVANITRSGTTFTATKRDGTTFTFTQQDNNTTYSLSSSGESVVLTPSSGTADSVTLSTLINGLGLGTSPTSANDYIVTQYAGGSQNTYYRRAAKNVINSTLVKLALGTDTSTTTQFLNKKGEWATPAGTTYSGGTGISIGTGNAINHSNSVTAQTTQKVYPIKIDAQGHISAYGTSPTTLSGYGITDAKIASGTITLGSNTITPLTSSSTLDATKLSGTIPSGCYTDTKNTAGSTDTSSKIFLIGATSQDANPQTYSDDQVSVTSGTLTANNLVTPNVICCSQTAGGSGGISLYSGTGQVTSYGIAMRTTTNSGKHGYVQGDWANYFYFSGATNRGWVYKHAGAAIASISGEGHAVFNGSVTIGGNTTNTSGARLEYDSNVQAVNFVFN